MYSPAWERLKETETVTLIANPVFHARIKKAMQKRKDKDKGFKLFLMSKDKFCIMRTVSEGNTLTFRLQMLDRIHWSEDMFNV
jgi:hypothetical protein